MAQWFLILAFHATTLQQFGPFATEAACQAAGKKVGDNIPGQIRYVCVPTQ